MNSQDEFDTVRVKRIVLYCCMMIITAIALVVFTIIKNRAKTLEDTYFWEVGILSCQVALFFMCSYGAAYVSNLVKRRRRGRSS